MRSPTGQLAVYMQTGSFVTCSYIFNAIAFLPFKKDDQRCIVGDFVDKSYDNLNYFVKYSRPLTEPRAMWDKIKHEMDFINNIL